MREIIEKDLSSVKDLLSTTLGVDSYSKIERMGGLTNHTYHVTLEDGREFVVRIPGEGTEELIVRSDEMVSTKLACDLGIDARLVYFGSDGSKVTEYIANAETMSAEKLCEPRHIRQIADIYKRIHSCGVDTGVPFEVFDMAAGYEKIIFDNNVPMFEDYGEKKARVMEIKAEIDRLINAPKVPCHNDPLCENWVEGDGRMYLIDWEYAGMNDGMWDVADVSIEASFDGESDSLLLSEYLGRVPTLEDRKHFLASKIYVDYLWTLWAKTRVPYDGQPMEDWAVERYERMKNNIAAFEKLEAKGENN
ncbi:MAG: phosphotransferase family protein [Clostridia bacterium]|nr:phosphotransferase family protein [Clostridia bacterium]